MKRKQQPSPAVLAARALATLAATAKREAKRAKVTAEASSAAAPVDSGTDPPPAGRFRRSCRTPTAQVPSNRPLRLLPLLWTARQSLVEAMPQYVYQPHPPGSHTHALQLSASRCVHRSARHARATCTRLRCGAGCAAASAAPIEPSTSAAQQPASPVRPLSACLPPHPPRRMRTRALDRPSTRLRLQSGDAKSAENASDAGSSASADDVGDSQVTPPPHTHTQIAHDTRI